jgi:hypothetical protein
VRSGTRFHLQRPNRVGVDPLLERNDRVDVLVVKIDLELAPRCLDAIANCSEPCGCFQHGYRTVSHLKLQHKSFGLTGLLYPTKSCFGVTLKSPTLKNRVLLTKSTKTVDDETGHMAHAMLESCSVLIGITAAER